MKRDGIAPENSLRRRLLRLVLPCAIGPFLIIVFWQTIEEKETREAVDRTHRLLETLAEDSRLAHDRLIEKIEERTREEARGAASQDVKLIEAAIENAERAAVGVSSESLITAFLSPAAGRSPEDVARIEERLREIVNHYGLISATIVQADGREAARAAALRTMNDDGVREELRNATTDESGSSWFPPMKTALARDSWVWACLGPNEDTRRDADHPAYPVSPETALWVGAPLAYSADGRPARGWGRLAGMLVLAFDMRAIADHAEVLRAGGCRVRFTDPTGRILGAPFTSDRESANSIAAGRFTVTDPRRPRDPDGRDGDRSRCHPGIDRDVPRSDR